MITSSRGLALIKASESCVLTAYPDPMSPLGKECARLHKRLTEYQQVPRWQLLSAHPVTIGWGHTGLGCKLGDSVTQETANSLLAMDVHFAEFALSGLKLNQNQFDALVSLIFNIGVKAFRESTLRTHLVSQNYEAAALEFTRWHWASGTPHVLDNRRKSERALFLTPVEEGAA